MTLSPGQRLGSYEILAPLGAGGMGEVYVARDLRLDRKVALKTLPERFVRDPAAYARFEREAKALAALNHPGILGIFDFGQQEEIVYTVTELLEGKTLREAMRGGPLPPRRAAELGVQAALALAAAHDRGIVHRDLKPENLFLTSDGVLKILDFGLARTELKPFAATLATEALDAPLTLEGTLVGTVGYMSPEQARGEASGPGSDLFALGVVLYEMVSGARPFQGASGIEVLNAILTADAPSMSGSGRIPPALERIIHHCLEKEPGARFQNARDLAFDLGHVDSGAAPGPAGPKRREGGAGRLLSAAALAAAVAAGFGFLAGVRRDPVPPTFTPLTRGRGTVSAARFVPGSKEVQYSASWNGEPERWYTRRMDQPGLRVVPGGEGPLLSVAGEGVAMGLTGAYLSHGQRVGRLFSLPSGGGAPRELADFVWAADQGTRPGEFASVQGLYGGDIRLEWPLGHSLLTSGQLLRHLRILGDRLAVFKETQGNVESGVILVMDREGRPRELAALDGVTGLAWGPGGKEVWVSTYHLGQSRFLALALSGGQRVLMQHAGRLELQDVAADGTVLAALNAWQRHTYCRRAGESVDRDLGWLDAQATMSLTADGGQALLANLGEWSSTEGPLYLRALDGKPPRILDLDSHMQPSLSPDGQWVAVATRDPGLSLNLLPTGRGLPSHMPILDFASNDLQVSALPGGKRALVWGSRKGAPLEFYLADLEAGTLKPVALGGHSPFLFETMVSPDGKHTAAISTSASRGKALTTIEILALDGEGPSRTPVHIAPGEAISGWTPDGAGLLIWDRNRLPAVLERLDVATGRRTPVLKITPPDPAGVSGIQGLFLAKDGRTYAYNVVSRLSDLFLIQGLR